MAKVTRQERAQANRDHALKIALETVLIKQLRPIFSQFMRKFRNQFKESAIVINAHVLQPRLFKVLSAAYKRTALTFRQDFVEQQKQDPQLEQSQQSINAFITATLPRQISIIINTTNDQLTNKIREIIADAIQTGKTLDIDALADLAFEEYNRILSSRIDMIAMFETQNVAEETKRHLVIPRATEIKTKKWVAVLDNRTRKSHAKADGQVQPITEPFIVMEQRLMRPSDTSMGATLDNVINCRCSSIYS